MIVCGRAHPNRPRRWHRSPRHLDTATLPADVRQKLGWLLLDHLRVRRSIGARLPWSDWSRAAMSAWSVRPARRMCCSRWRPSIHSTRPSSMSPMVRVLMLTTPMSGRCCIPASRHGRRRWRSPNTPGRRDPRCWRRWWRVMRLSSASGLRCSQAISNAAASRAPALATASAPRRRPGGCCSGARDRARKIADALGLGRWLRQRAGAVLLFRGVGQAHPCGPCGGGRRSRPRCSRSRATARPNDIIEGQVRRLRPRLCRWVLPIPVLIEEGLGKRFHLMDVLVKSHAAASASRRRHRCDAGIARAAQIWLRPDIASDGARHSEVSSRGG